MATDLFHVRLTRQAEKDVRELRPWADRILRALKGLENDPRRGHLLRGSLAGARSLEFSLPGGAHRAVYVVLEDERVCLVFLVGAHEGIYERAERRVQALRHQGTI